MTRPVEGSPPVAPTDHPAIPEWDTSSFSDLCLTCEWPVSRKQPGHPWQHDARNPVEWTDRRTRVEGSPPDWRTMTRDAFDTSAREVQTALIPAPDPAGTGDLLTLLTD
jgi:hypothetical protein